MHTKQHVNDLSFYTLALGNLTHSDAICVVVVVVVAAAVLVGGVEAA